MKSREKVMFFLALGILLICLSANSQIRESGAIQGNVTDTEGAALPGVTVTIESPNLIGGPQTLITDANGFYKFRALALGTYKVTAQLTGFKTMVKEGIELHLGMTLTCDFRMVQAAEEKEIVVLADIPTIDTKSSQPKPIIYTDEFLVSLPGKSSWSNLAFLAPGVSQTYSSVGYAWQHDGIDTSFPFNGMAGFIADTRIIKEASVQSLGLPAEYGEFSGVVLSSVSKSGSNRFSTFNEFSYNGKKWNSQNVKKAPVAEWYTASMGTREYATNPLYDISSQFGGKIIRDKLWFFVSGEYSTSKTPITGLDKARDNKAMKAFAKLTFQLNNSNKFNLALNRAKSEYTNGAISVTNPDIGYDSEYPTWYGNLNWTSIFSPTTFLDVKAGYNYYSSQVMPHGGLDKPGTYDNFLYKYFDNYTDATATTTKTYHASAHLSHYIPQFLKGSHDTKVGIEFVKYAIIWDRKAPGDKIYTNRNGAPFEYENRLRWYQDTYVNTIIGFIQDRWSLTQRLTLNLGVRIDNYRFYFPSESSTRGTVYRSTAIAPRLGISYDLLGDRKNIVKIAFSYYYEGMMRNWFGNFEHRYAGGARYRWNTTTKSWDLIYAETPSAPPTPIPVDSGISQPYIWEISGGFERELFRDASLAVNFWWREIGKSMEVLYFDDVYGPWTTTNPGPDGKVGTADDMGPITLYRLTYRGTQLRLVNPKNGNPPWMDWDVAYKNRAFEVRFTKKFSNSWQLMASYLYNRTTGNTTGVFAGSTYDPNRNINAYGDRGYNEPHQFNLQGNILLPLDISFSAVFSWKSGRYLDDLVVIYPPSYRYYPQIYVNPVGKGKKADPVNNLDLKLEKQFRYRGATLGIGLDIFNATNNYGGSGELSTSFGLTYGKRTYIKTPRTFQMNIRIIY